MKKLLLLTLFALTAVTNPAQTTNLVSYTSTASWDAPTTDASGFPVSNLTYDLAVTLTNIDLNIGLMSTNYLTIKSGIILTTETLGTLFSPLSKGTYKLNLRSVNPTGDTSDWTNITVTLTRKGGMPKNLRIP